MAGGDAPTDFDAVADELFRLPPAQFTAARDAHARAARQAGDRALADRITALRKPTASAWAANLLAREHHEETGPLLQLGEALRRAHRDLDGEQLRQLNRRQRELVRALSRQAGQLAADAGHPLAGQAVQEVEETLHAALADPDAGAAFTEGRLSKPLSATVDITGRATTAPVPDDVPHRPTRKRPAQAAENRERARREAELRRRREEAAQAEQEARARESDAAAAREDLAAAGRHRDEAQHRLDELLEQAEQAEEALRAARDDQDDARRRLRAADRAARDARRRAGKAAAHAEQPAGGPEGES